MATLNLKQGETGSIILPVVDKFGSPVQIGSASNIRVVAYSNGVEFKRFNEPSIVGMDTIGVDTVYNTLELFFDRESTKLASIGTFVINVLLENYIDSSNSSFIEYSFEVGKITKGILKDEII